MKIPGKAIGNLFSGGPEKFLNPFNAPGLPDQIKSLGKGDIKGAITPQNPISKLSGAGKSILGGG